VASHDGSATGGRWQADEGVLGEAQEGECRGRSHACSDHDHPEAEAGTDERRRQEGHVEAHEGVLGEAEESQAVGCWGPGPVRARSTLSPVWAM